MRCVAPGCRLALLALAVAFLGGCTYYPSVLDTGGVRMEPKNGRLVRMAGGALCFFDLYSTGKYGDQLLAAESGAAKRAEIVAVNGTPLGALLVPGMTRIDFRPDGPRVVLTELTQPLNPGDGVIVTLIFQKSGRIGVVSVVE
jgi:copper(I)-binding protein